MSQIVLSNGNHRLQGCLGRVHLTCHFARLLVVIFLGVGHVTSAAAQTVTVTFESLKKSGTGYEFLRAPYRESGFVITPTTGFCVIQTEHPDFYMGAMGLSNCFGNELNTLTRADGGTFSLISMDLSPFAKSYGGGAPVNFVGTRLDNSTVTASFRAPLLPGFATYSFSG